MADDGQPPPLFADDDTKDNDEDLFAASSTKTVQPEPMSDPLQDDSCFAETSSSLDTEVSRALTDAMVTEPLGVASADKPKANIPKSTSLDIPAAAAAAVGSSALKSLSGFGKDDDSEDDSSKYTISVSIISPKKVGDGVGAYMVYKVVTKSWADCLLTMVVPWPTQRSILLGSVNDYQLRLGRQRQTDIPDFRQTEMEVYRRFSDFLGLHEKLVVKHLHQGRIIPPAPEKSVIGMTKIKMSSEEAGSLEFVERRRSALERFINRVAAHPDLQTDPSFVDFLEVEGDLPRATSTSALSSAGVMRLFSRVGDSIGKITFKIDEADEWFEERALQLETLDSQLKKLHSSIETLVLHRRELSQGAGQLARAVATLGTAEEHTSLARALSQLSEVEEKVESVHQAQSDADFYILSELIHDYIGMVHAVKEALAERVKLYRAWKDGEANLAKKRELKSRLEMSHKTDKLNETNREISELERRAERDQEEFESISRQLRKELSQFDHRRCLDFQSSIVVYLESLMNTQQQLIKHWELFLPEAKSIV